jgi:hypothetical protein
MNMSAKYVATHQSAYIAMSLWKLVLLVSLLAAIVPTADGQWMPEPAPWLAEAHLEAAPSVVPATAMGATSELGARPSRSPWLFMAIGAGIGATAFTYKLVEDCERADCVGIHAPYTIVAGGFVGGLVGLGVGWIYGRIVEEP